MADTLGMLNKQHKNRVRSEIELNEHDNLIDNDLFQKMIICLDGPVITHKKTKKKRAEKNVRYFTNRHQCSKNFFNNVNQDDLHNKPRGLWYSCGVDWYNYSYNIYPEKISNKRVYSFDVDYTLVLKISTEKELYNFNKKYTRKDGVYIDWMLVSQKYSGIEICPYFLKYKFTFSKKNDSRIINSWYYNWTVASGCIWDINAISNVIYGGKLPPLKLNYSITQKDKSKNLSAFILIIGKLLKDDEKK